VFDRERDAGWSFAAANIFASGHNLALGSIHATTGKRYWLIWKGELAAKRPYLIPGRVDNP